ncbi:MAG TPA: mechanosensitive ion channel family protein [Terriglobales bacterium]|nr:mechanosensitive ion channel family protein [Terriglobales bacterium]
MLPLSYRELLPALISLGGLLLLLWLLLWLAVRGVRRWAQAMGREDLANREAIGQWEKQLNKVLRRTIAAVAMVATAMLLLRGFGLHGLKRLGWEEVEGWATGPGLRILMIAVGAYALNRVLRLSIEHLSSLMVPAEGTRIAIVEREKRAQTLSRTLGKLVTALLFGIAGLMMLRELRVDIMPILTGAGIVGLAVGFGAQHLVRDVISGFFIILENQIRVGDIVNINGKGGLVEAIRLRTTVIRSFDGTVHIFPNGAITEVSNLTKDYSFAVLDLGVAYKENVDRVMEVLREIGNQLETDAEWREKILEPLEIAGVDRFADSAVIIKMRIKTLPQEQFNVGRELRRRIKNRFDALGIEIPYPHVSVYFGEASRPFAVDMADRMRAFEPQERPASKSAERTD